MTLPPAPEKRVFVDETAGAPELKPKVEGAELIGVAPKLKAGADV